MLLNLNNSTFNIPTSIRVVTETYSSGTDWYRVYSDGWCEQGGYNSVNNQNVSISLLKTMQNTNYSTQITVFSSSYGEYMAHCISSISNSSFNVHKYIGNWSIIWTVCGYISNYISLNDIIKY